MVQEGDFIRITALGTLQGATNPVINVFDFFCFTGALNVPLELVGQEIAEAFVARYFTPLAASISNRYTLSGISIREYGNPSVGWDGADTYFTGADATPMMPPFVAYSVMRIRANFSMRQGRKAYAGVPTSAIDANGFPNPNVLANFNSVFSAWEAGGMFVENTSNDLLFLDRLINNADLRVIPTVTSAVTGYQLRGFGSQNGRKG